MQQFPDANKVLDFRTPHQRTQLVAGNFAHSIYTNRPVGWLLGFDGRHAIDDQVDDTPFLTSSRYHTSKLCIGLHRFDTGAARDRRRPHRPHSILQLWPGMTEQVEVFRFSMAKVKTNQCRPTC